MPTLAQRIPDFDLWRQGYAGATVQVLKAGTTEAADIFLDPAALFPANNPQTLQSTSVGNTTFGKWIQPIYVTEAYYLRINSIDETGAAQIALQTVVGEDVSESIAKPRRANVTRQVQDIIDQQIFARDYGAIGDEPATNTATINAAIGAAATQQGGAVILPSGNIEINNLSLPENVILVGQGRDATTLRSVQAQNVITMGGERCGLMMLTLDGNNLVPDGVGVFSEAKDRIIFVDVDVKRFETGVKFEGGAFMDWRNLFITNCESGAILKGVTDAPFEFNQWRGGAVRQCTGEALHLEFDGDWVRHNAIEAIRFEENVGDSTLKITGAPFTKVIDCSWVSNIRNIDIADGADTSQEDKNQVISLLFDGGFMIGGELRLDGRAQDIQFSRFDFRDVDWDLQIPTNKVLLTDCFEDRDVSISFGGDKLARFATDSFGEIRGVTTDNAWITAWQQEIEPGQVAYVEAKAIGNRRDGVGYCVAHVASGATRPGAELNFINKISNFTIGTILTGGTSGATARIIDADQAGASGDLTLRDIIGTFVDGETLTDTSTGEATADGAISLSNAALDSEGSTKLRTTAVTATKPYDARINVSTGKVVVQVRGETDEILEWVVRVERFAP